MNYRSPLGKVKCQGSAKEGSAHWMAQRVSAVMLLFIITWLLYAILQIPVMDLQNASAAEIHKFAIDWYSSPLNSFMAILFVITMFYHGALGMQVVIEDYVHKECCKTASIMLVKIISFTSAALGVFAILSIYFKG